MSTSRRDAEAALAVAAPFVPLAASPKRVIVAGAGIGGLSCAWELVRRGHDVVVLEAAARTGGHVFTVRDGLDDGLYADGGAEHFTQPGYERFWSYVREFDLPYLYYPRREHVLRWIGGRMYTEEQLRDRCGARRMGFNAREMAFIGAHGWPELLALYFKPYVDAFPDEYRPFDAKLDHLDALTLNQLLERDGASAATLRMFGGSGSALQAVWHAAILAHRGVPLWPPKVYRLVGGNQSLPDAFTARLGDPASASDRRCAASSTRPPACGCTAAAPSAGGWTRLEADHLVCAMSAIMLSRVEVEAGLAAGEGVRDQQRAVLLRHARHPAVEEPVLAGGGDQPEHGVWRSGARPLVDERRGGADAEGPGARHRQRRRLRRRPRSPRSAGTTPAGAKTWSARRWWCGPPTRGPQPASAPATPPASSASSGPPSSSRTAASTSSARTPTT
jgi:hypothetical protein